MCDLLCMDGSARSDASGVDVQCELRITVSEYGVATCRQLVKMVAIQISARTAMPVNSISSFHLSYSIDVFCPV